MKSPEYLLVLTATITPSANTVARADPAVRRDDYKRALAHWIDLPDDRVRRILFLENSSADLADFRDLVAQRNRPGLSVEFQSVPLPPPPTGLHYGYDELRMLDVGLEKSQLRQQTTHMIKATGRLHFPRIRQLLDRLPADFDIAVDTRRRIGVRPFVPTNLFLCSHRFYDQNLRGIFHELRKDDPFFIEHLFYNKLIPLESDPRVVLRWPVSVEPQGIGAHSGRNYSSPQQRIVSAARSTLRKLAPDFWM